jgi:hypothetical protein
MGYTFSQYTEEEVRERIIDYCTRKQGGWGINRREFTNEFRGDRPLGTAKRIYRILDDMCEEGLIRLMYDSNDEEHPQAMFVRTI